MGTYIVGDLHGCYDEWISLKEAIENQDSKARFILVGDIIDRGRKGRKLMRWCMLHVSERGRYQMVIGNHEYEQLKRERNPLKRVFLKSLPFYKDMAVYGQRFIIAHAGIPDSAVKHNGSIKKNAELTEEEQKVIVWSRQKGPVTTLPNAILVHGHTPTLFEEAFDDGNYSADMLGRIYRSGNRINVDCGIGYLHRRLRRLAALRLEDMKEFYYEP